MQLQDLDQCYPHTHALEHQIMFLIFSIIEKVWVEHALFGHTIMHLDRRLFRGLSQAPSNMTALWKQQHINMYTCLWGCWRHVNLWVESVTTTENGTTNTVVGPSIEKELQVRSWLFHFCLHSWIECLTFVLSPPFNID